MDSVCFDYFRVIVAMGIFKREEGNNNQKHGDTEALISNKSSTIHITLNSRKLDLTIFAG
jgi:hypothetical protein